MAREFGKKGLFVECRSGWERDPSIRHVSLFVIANTPTLEKHMIIMLNNVEN